MIKHSKFWNNISHKYLQKPVKNQKAYDQKLESIKHLLKPDSRVLEAGCGTGSTALHLADYVEHYDAIDFSKNMIDIAVKRAAEANITNVKFDNADLEEFTPMPSTYDVVMAHSVLHLIDNSEQVLDRMLISLKRDGYLVLSLVLIDKLPLLLKVALDVVF